MPRYRIVRGMRLPLGFPEAGFESGQGYAASAGDIFVASYPKCGTTWLQYIVWLLVRRRPLAADESLTNVFPHLEEVGAEVVEALAGPRLIKTHLRFGLTPWSDAARYLVIARNPFDCAVSFYHHTRGFPLHYDFADGRFGAFFDCFLSGEVDFGDYFDHLESWYAERSRSNIALLTYEELRRAPLAAVRRIALFLGDAAAEAAGDPAALAGVVREAGIESMRRDQRRWSSARPAWATEFVRKGAVGDWQTLFTPDQAAALLAKFEARLGGTPLESLWPEVLEAARVYAAGS